jgi:hypothetical protein
LKELLRCKDLCIIADYKLCFIKKPSASRQKHLSIIDFLNLATRHLAPGEMLSQKMLNFVPLVRILLAHAIPHTYIQNKILLQQALAHGGRVKKTCSSMNKMYKIFVFYFFSLFYSSMADSRGMDDGTDLDLVRKNVM